MGWDTFGHAVAAARALWRMVPRGDERGSSSVEYGVVVFLIGATVLVAVAVLGLATHSDLGCAAPAFASMGC